MDRFLIAPCPDRRHEVGIWQVSPRLAESFLTQCRDCQFPWPDSRDERKRGSSLPGADLVGFHREREVDRFAFGEVKTSAGSTYPPGTVYGRHGLTQQLEDLRDCREIRDRLVRYLALRSGQASWRNRFRSAATVYFRNTCEVRIFGLLVRDVPPHQDDLRARVNRLALNCPATMSIELVAIYLPPGRITVVAELDSANTPDKLTAVIQHEQWEDFRCYVNHLVHEIGNLERVLASAELSLRNTFGYRVLQESVQGRGRAHKLLEATKLYAQKISANPGQVAMADMTGFSYEGVGRALAGVQSLEHNLSADDFSATRLFGTAGDMADLYGIMLKISEVR